MRRLWSKNELLKLYGLKEEKLDNYKKAWALQEIYSLFNIENHEDTSKRAWSEEMLLEFITPYNIAKVIYINALKENLFEAAWESSLTVIPSEISENSAFSNYRGTAQYPNGETEGVIIPHSVTNIGNFAFYGWQSNNQPLVIPNSVTSIGNYAFGYWQKNNQPLVIPNSVTSIGNVAFAYWESNNHPLVIPNSVTSIGNFAFGYWFVIPYIIIEAETPPTLSNQNAFDNQNDAPIYVPHDSVALYKNATNWATLTSRIFSIKDKP